MSQNNAVFIVGNKFKAFAKNPGVYTFHNFIKNICNNDNLLKSSRLHLGQGLNDREVDVIKSLMASENEGRIKKTFMQRAIKEVTHKRKEKNILISDPIKLNEEKMYSAELYINDDCDEMKDHITGQHIQGMILIEAARQMTIAVAEKYILSENEKNHFYCTLLSENNQCSRRADREGS